MKKYTNLLPPREQKQVKLLRVQGQLLNFSFWLILSLLILIVSFFAAQVFLSSELELTNNQVSAKAGALANVEVTALRREVKLFNQDLANFQTLNLKRQNLSQVLIEFARALPPEVTLDSFGVNLGDYKVEVTGRALTRAAVLKLRKNLLASSYFTNVNFPLSNLEKPTNVAWKYRFYIRPEH